MNTAATCTCQEAIERLKRNREAVSLRALRTKYARAFNELLESINKGINSLIGDCFDGLPFFDDSDKKEFIKKANVIIDDPLVFCKIQDAAYVQMDYDKLVDVLTGELAPKVLKEAYEPYWRKHCSEKNGRIYNDLIDAVWNPHDKVWERDDGSFSLGFEP